MVVAGTWGGEGYSMRVESILSAEEMMQRIDRVGRPTRPQPPYRMLFPESLIAKAAQHLRESGVVPLEQLVLWSGYPTPEGVVVAAVLMPETEATWGWVHVLPLEQPKIVAWLRQHGQLLFAESHTHGSGPRATELSCEDRRHPAGRQEGFLTIIVTDYARFGIQFERAGVWACRNLEWVRVSPQQTRERLLIVTDAEARRVLG